MGFSGGNRFAFVGALLASLFGALLGAFATGAAAAPVDDRIPGHYIVVLEDSVESPGEVARAQLRQHGGKPGLLYRSALKGYSAQLSRQAVESLRANPRVKYVAPDRVVELDAQTTPEGVRRIFATQNPLLDIDSVADVGIDADVAVIDTGIDSSHPDLNVVEWVNCVPADEKTFTGCVEEVGVDGSGHGTHVAGTVAALDNDLGVVGVAPGARLWAVRVLGSNGAGAISWIVAGIDWVTARSASIEVANMSIGGSGASLPQSEAIRKSVEKGVVYSVSAGNLGSNSETQRPANHPDVITVSALADYNGLPGGGASSTCRSYGPDDDLADFSNWGSGVELAAPGVCVLSTVPGEKYEYESGTSMATPHVTGAAAILASESNPETRADVEAIRDTLIQRGSLDWNDSSADGRPEPLLYLGGQPLTQTEVATGGATSLDGKSATLYGAINPRGRITQYRFEWGTTTAYGHSAPAAAKDLVATNYTVVSESISGLEPEQTYHYRLVATNAEGTTYGRDRTVTPSRWQARTPVSTPAGLQQAHLNGVSCPAQGSCMAVFWYYTGKNHTGSYRLAAGEWRFEPMPVPTGGNFAQTYDVSCPSTTACTAVGKYELSDGTVVPLVERWNGSDWSVQAVPSPFAASPYVTLQGVSCASTAECVAVGYYLDASGDRNSWSALWRNGSWSVLATPAPSEGDGKRLLDVSCSSATHCVAIGGYDDAAGYNTRLIMRWNGSSWVIQTPAAPRGLIYGVDCVSAAFCVLVGGGPVSEIWDGSQWTTRAPALLAESTDARLKDVSCKSTSYCVAVGAWDRGDKHQALTEIWDGTAWKVQANRFAAEAAEELNGVSCLALAGCLSVGASEQLSEQSLILERHDASAATATEVTARRATLRGTVDPGGVQTSYHFEFGPTTAYGTKVPAASLAVGSGVDPVAVSQEVAGLEPWTTYHARLVATNASGTAYGDDVTFKTKAATPTLSLSFGASGSGNGQLNRPRGMAVDKEGNVWVADCQNHRLQKFSPSGQYLTKFGSFGSAAGQLNCPQDVALTASGDLWVTDSENDRVQKFTPAGQYLSQFGSSGTAVGKFAMPKGIAVAPDGTIWVTDHLYRRVQQFSAAGAYIRTVGATGNGGTGQTSFLYPDGIAIDPAGNVWVADRKNHKVQKLSSSGQFLMEFGTLGAAAGQLELPTAIDVTAAGHLVIADRSTGRIQQFTPSGEYVTQFGPKTSGEQEGIAVGPGGATYVAQGTLSRVEKWVEPVE